MPPKDRDMKVPLDHTYLSSLYYTLLSLVAANDPMPSSPLELVLACAICLGGSLATGILVGEFAASFSSSLAKINNENELSEQLADLMGSLSVDESL